MKTFDDLEFKPHPSAIEYKRLFAHRSKVDPFVKDMCEATQARMDFPNGYGISVLCGTIFYSNGKDTYEVGVFYKDRLIQWFEEDSVRGWQTKEQVTEIMRQVQETES